MAGSAWIQHPGKMYGEVSAAFPGTAMLMIVLSWDFIPESKKLMAETIGKSSAFNYFPDNETNRFFFVKKHNQSSINELITEMKRC